MSSETNLVELTANNIKSCDIATEMADLKALTDLGAQTAWLQLSV